jgi:glutamate-ammonia-ligase adenylyltransferase
LSKLRDKSETLQEVAEMRARLAAAKAADGTWDAKNGPGRLQDIELLAQAGALLQGGSASQISSGLDAAAKSGIISGADTQILKEAYSICWALQSATRLLSAKVLRSDQLGQAGKAFLTRSLKCDSLDALELHLAETYKAAAAVIRTALQDYDDVSKAAPEKETP